MALYKKETEGRWGELWLWAGPQWLLPSATGPWGLLSYKGHVQANVHIVQAMVTQEEEDEELSDSRIFLSLATWWEPGVCACIYSNKHMAEKPKFN